MTRAVLLLALLAGACASAQPAPISYGRGEAAAQRAPTRIEDRRTPAPVETRASARTPAVQEAPDWAVGEGTPLSAWALQPGDAQPYDPANLPRTHRVGADESLYDIASRYQAPLRALIDQNNLEPPYALTPGRELRLPPPRFHTVARNEALEDIARAYNVDTRSLALLNRMEAPYRVRAGDRIVLPAMARAEVAPAAPSARVAAAPNGAPAMQAANAHLALPMRGRIVARFGAQPSGGRLDGIEIAGSEGDRINAAADGDVVYAGSDLPAYGELVLVRHANDLVTAYAYTRRALVREGQRVRAGEAIAELGARAEGGPRLLFQVRQGSTPVDPAPLLGLTN
ncbi:M23 family metallopeptidase [Vitreimonas flagellata]|uniref:M23 family metallopeptidase n=1 Tax=Vitreimonas flagellata TaxID=2560861 RepID=UPI00107506D5|nr:M23 family metallopeptidase [Vitreimonas flagellata]